jgi:tetratricopeptide (TPR) repeat protein
MPSRNDMMMSGPLPTLDGFDELQAMVTANPNDIGAHMALALAYTQVGDLDTSLRVYRRILKKRTISPGILQLIVEELSDFEADANGRAHFHQVRGDLYMKQGRFHEAVQEYNKIS